MAVATACDWLFACEGEAMACYPALDLSHGVMYFWWNGIHVFLCVDWSNMSERLLVLHDSYV